MADDRFLVRYPNGAEETVGEWQWQPEQHRWALVARVDGHVLAETVARRWVRQTGPEQHTGDWETWVEDYAVGVYGSLHEARAAAETRLRVQKLIGR